MWKENYRLGIENLDAQHYELFKMVDHLMRVIRIDKSAKHKEEYVQAIHFTKEYAYQHFKDEEDYMLSIEYHDYEEHKKQHDAFKKVVFDSEQNFMKNGYTANEIKKFAGTLVAWLIYHVAKSDQKIVESTSRDISAVCLKCLQESASDVFERMGGAQTLSTQLLTTESTIPANDIRVTIGFIGDIDLTAAFIFPKETAFQLIKNMTFMEMNAIDDLVCSAMAEIVNITSGNVATMLAERNYTCDIKPPVVILGSEDLNECVRRCMNLHTNAGDVYISIV